MSSSKYRSTFAREPSYNSSSVEEESIASIDESCSYNGEESSTDSPSRGQILLYDSQGQIVSYHSEGESSYDSSPSREESSTASPSKRQLVLYRASSFSEGKSAIASLSKGHIAQAIQLLNSAYGTVDDPDFPLPMRSSEAGKSKFIWGKSKLKQRRYLWTDSFAVLAYQTLAEYYMHKGDHEEARFYLGAVKKLIWVVHETLGRPRSNKDRDAMKLCDFGEPLDEDMPKPPKKYVGLRIGKVQSRKVTDDGSTYDGQYWHHTEKWLFALARTQHVKDGIWIAKSCFPYFFQFGRSQGGMRSKLSVDATPPPTQPHIIGPDNNNINALIVFTMLESQNPNKEEVSLQDEIALLQSSVKNYCPTPISDPVEWGMEAVFDQFVRGHPLTEHWHFSDYSSDMFNPTRFTRPYRMYGALIGALVHGSVVPHDRLDEMMDSCIRFHQWRGMESKDYKYATLDRTMLAVAFLSPGILKRRLSDPMVQV